MAKFQSEEQTNVYTLTKPPLLFRVRRSKYKLGFILIIHFLAFAACLFNGLLIQYQLIFLILVTTSFFIQLSVYNIQDSVTIKYMYASGWEIAPDEQSTVPVDLVATTVVTSLFIVLRFKQSEISKLLVIFKDALSDKEYRKLKATIKISGSNSGKHE